MEQNFSYNSGCDSLAYRFDVQPQLIPTDLWIANQFVRIAKQIRIDSFLMNWKMNFKFILDLLA